MNVTTLHLQAFSLYAYETAIYQIFTNQVKGILP